MSLKILCNNDSWISEQYPDNNWGGGAYVRACASPVNHGLLEFNISGIDMGSVNSVYLYLHSKLVNYGTYIVERMTSHGWDESTVTWNLDKPTYTSTNSTTITIAGGTPPPWNNTDITNLFKDEVGSTLGIYLRAASGKVDCMSKESSAPPYILINGVDKYVDIATGSDTDDGNSWANAYLTAKKGIDNSIPGITTHIAFGDYSAQAAIDLDKNLELLCEDNGGGGTGTVTLPTTV